MNLDAGRPTIADVEQIAVRFSGEAVVTCSRFPTGLRNWVYDLVLASGAKIVVRMSDPDNRAELAGGLFWHEHLDRVGVRVPAVLTHDLTAPKPYVILERLPGTDIGEVHDDLSDQQIRAAASAVSEMQSLTATLPPATGYGFALSYDSTLHSSWKQLLRAELERASQWIESTGVVDAGWSRRVHERVVASDFLLDQVTPTAYLHDATTKNVIVDNGRVVGLVDFDEMGFGDPLYAIALTRMSLLAAGRATTYADAQMTRREPSSEDAGLLDLYTAVHGLSFLGELGQRFNQDTIEPVDDDFRNHLESVLSALLES